MLTFEHVRKNYDSKRVLDDCSISFEPGKVYALVGPNGTGKSTLMKAAAGLVKINGGTLTYKGQPLKNGIAAFFSGKQSLPVPRWYCVTVPQVRGLRSGTFPRLGE